VNNIDPSGNITLSQVSASIGQILGVILSGGYF